MWGIFILDRGCPCVVGWTFGAATLGGGAVGIDVPCGENVGVCLLGCVGALDVEMGNGLSCCVPCGLFALGSVSGCLNGA